MFKWLVVAFVVVAAGACSGAAPGAGEEPEPEVEVVGLNAPIRAWHFVLKPMALRDGYRLIDVAQKAGYNTVVVQLAWGLRLDHAPWGVEEGAWSKKEFGEWVAKARSLGMAVVPELQLLTHQKKLFQDGFPSLMYNKATYDPRNPMVYEKVFALIDEVIAMIQPKAFHIGHDEVAGRNPRNAKKKLRPGEQMLPAELFLADVLKLNTFLRQRGIEVWMWADMLIAPAEFPDMIAGPLHGDAAGYGRPIRDALPRNIVLCDWHYHNGSFSSLGKLKQEGFKVIGSSWKNLKSMEQFSRYAAMNGAYGMMATTWFHVSRREWGLVDDVLIQSGAVFLRDFPNETK